MIGKWIDNACMQTLDNLLDSDQWIAFDFGTASRGCLLTNAFKGGDINRFFDDWAYYHDDHTGLIDWDAVLAEFKTDFGKEKPGKLEELYERYDSMVAKFMGQSLTVQTTGRGAYYHPSWGMGVTGLGRLDFDTREERDAAAERAVDRLRRLIQDRARRVRAARKLAECVDCPQTAAV